MSLYERAVQNIAKRYTVADGYNGTRAEFGLSLVDGTAYEVFSFGCIRARMRPYEFTFSSVSEMLAAADECPLYQTLES